MPGMREIPCHYVLSLFCSPRKTGRTSASCAAATAYLPPPATSGFAAGRKDRPAFRTAPARPVTHPAAHLTTSLTFCVWRTSFISTGARKIKRWLEDRGHGMPAFSTVHNLMARHGLLPGAAPGVPATGRFEHAAPNRLWQMDFKGHFPLAAAAATAYPAGRPLPVLAVPVHCADERRETVQEQLVSVFERYGLPDRMTMDNGSPWGDTTGTGRQWSCG